LTFAQLSGGKPPFPTCIRRSLSHFGEDWSLMILHVVPVRGSRWGQGTKHQYSSFTEM